MHGNELQLVNVDWCKEISEFEEDNFESDFWSNLVWDVTTDFSIYKNPGMETAAILFNQALYIVVTQDRKPLGNMKEDWSLIISVYQHTKDEPSFFLAPSFATALQRSTMYHLAI